MTLTSEQIRAIGEGESVSIVLPEVGKECVVLRKDVYDRVKRTRGDDLPTPLTLSRMMAAATEDDDLDSYQQYKR